MVRSQKNGVVWVTFFPPSSSLSFLPLPFSLSFLHLSFSLSSLPLPFSLSSLPLSFSSLSSPPSVLPLLASSCCDPYPSLACTQGIKYRKQKQSSFLTFSSCQSQSLCLRWSSLRMMSPMRKKRRNLMWTQPAPPASVPASSSVHFLGVHEGCPYIRTTKKVVMCEASGFALHTLTSGHPGQSM